MKKAVALYAAKSHQHQRVQQANMAGLVQTSRSHSKRERPSGRRRTSLTGDFTTRKIIPMHTTLAHGAWSGDAVSLSLPTGIETQGEGRAGEAEQRAAPDLRPPGIWMFGSCQGSTMHSMPSRSCKGPSDHRSPAYSGPIGQRGFHGTAGWEPPALALCLSDRVKTSQESHQP